VPVDAEDSFDKAVRLKIYELLLASGSMPSVHSLAESFGHPLDQVREALKRLRQKKSLVLMPQSGEILMCQPWCAIPTPHVAHAGGRDWFAPCIWDVLAIPAAMGVRGSITTSCPCCGERMTAELHEGKLLKGTGIVHIGLPAKQWWDDPFFT
jgi:hypothetical protein